MTPPTNLAYATPMSNHITIDRWGKDHWSLLAYVESVCVDGHGEIDLRRMRCDADRHPGYAVRQGFDDNSHKKYSTRLQDGELQDHDDWDCLDDLEAAGLVEDVGFTMQPRYTVNHPPLKGRA